MSLSDHLTSLSHHAYYIVGDDSTVITLREILENKCKIPLTANPDLFDRAYATFNIEDARELKSFHDTRPIGVTGKKIFSIYMNAVTNEAQNALLKLLEEPSDYAHFFIIIPSAHLLLPTVKSRLLLLDTDVDIEINDDLVTEVEKFMKMAAGKKLEYIKKLVDDIYKEKKTRQDAIAFLDAIESQVYERKNLNKDKNILESISLVRRYIYDRAPSVKMLLEYLALIPNN